MKALEHFKKSENRSGRAVNNRVSRRTNMDLMTYVIMSPCLGVKDGTCVSVCPVDCIHEGDEMFYIDPEECIACGLCESICPVDAIRPIDEVPTEETAYIEKNAAFFAPK